MKEKNIIIERISEHNRSFTSFIFNLFKNSGYGEYDIDMKFKDIIFKKVKIIFNTGEYYSVFKPINSKIENGVFYNITLQFNIPMKYDVTKVKENITHEINHATEYFNILKNEKTSPIHDIIKMALLNTQYQKDTPFELFRHAIYLSLDNELNARAAQIFQYLIRFRSTSYDFLYKKLKESDIWEQYDFLLTMDIDKITKHITKKISISDLSKLINDFNNKLISRFDVIGKKLPNNYKFIKEIITENDNSILIIKKYLNNWKILIQEKLEKHKEKLIEMIDIVIINTKELQESYSYNSNIYSYEEYIKCFKAKS